VKGVKKVEEIHGGNIYKYPNVLDFSANINPFGPPEGVLKRMHHTMQKIEQYPDDTCARLREKLGQFLGVSPDSLICGNGAADLIYRLAWAIRPKHAMVLSPCFSEYEKALNMLHTKVEHFWLPKENFLLPDTFLERITESLDFIVLCNPNNPTGQLIPPEQMKHIVEKCEKMHVFLLIDECFLPFLEEEKRYSFLNDTKVHDNIFVLRAFTKMYAVPGLRLGYGVCSNASVLERMQNAGPPWNVSTLAQEAGEAALFEQSYVKKTIAYLNEEKAYLYKELEKLPLLFWYGAANYIFMKGPEDLQKRLLDKGILIRDCSNYINLEKGYYRIAVRTHKENQILLEQLKNILIR